MMVISFFFLLADKANWSVDVDGEKGIWGAS